MLEKFSFSDPDLLPGERFEANGRVRGRFGSEDLYLKRLNGLQRLIDAGAGGGFAAIFTFTFQPACVICIRAYQ